MRFKLKWTLRNVTMYSCALNVGVSCVTLIIHIWFWSEPLIKTHFWIWGLPGSVSYKTLTSLNSATILNYRKFLPCDNLNSSPSKVKGTSTGCFSAGMPKPLNPTLLFRQSVKSCFMSDNATLSWGLLGPDNDGVTVDKSSSTIYRK